MTVRKCLKLEILISSFKHFQTIKQKNKLVPSVFWRIYGAPICLKFYLTFRYCLIIYYQGDTKYPCRLGRIGLTIKLCFECTVFLCLSILGRHDPISISIVTKFIKLPRLCMVFYKGVMPQRPVEGQSSEN